VMVTCHCHRKRDAGSNQVQGHGIMATGIGEERAW